MAFSITCPKCSAKLKTAAAIPVGRSVQCPKCKTSFPVTNENMEEVSDGKPAATAPVGKPVAAAAKAAPAAAAAVTKKASSAFDNLNADGRGSSTRKRDDDDDDRPRRGDPEENGSPKGRKREDDDDDRPRSRKRDDDDDRPSKRGRDDDDDDRPRSRKRDDDDDDRPSKRKRDDDDDRPRSKKRGGDDDNRDRKRSRDDDDDDKPRSRNRDDDDDRPSKRRRDDDDDDDRPSKKKKKKKKKSGGGMMLWVILGSVGLLAGVGILLWFLFGGGGYDKEMLALMPSDVTRIEGDEVEKIADIAKFKKLIEREFNNEGKYGFLKKAGVTIDDIKRTMEGRTEKGENIIVVRLKKDADQGKFTQGGTEAKAGEKKYWKVKQNDSADAFVAFPSDDLVLVVSKEETIKSILNKEEGKIVISETLKELVGKVAGGTHWDAHENKRSGGMGGFEPQGPDAEFIKASMNSKGGATRIDLSSSSFDVVHYQLYASSDDAKKVYDLGVKKREEAKKNIDQMFNEGMAKSSLTEAQKEAIRKSFRNADYSQSGSYIESSNSLDLGPFEDLEKIPFLGLGF